MKDTKERLDVIAIGAHPDDVEVACGGTLARLAQQGYRVGIIDLTDGEPTPHGKGTAARLAEAAAAARELGVHERVQLGLPNRQLMDTVESRIALAIQFRRLRPRIVLGFGDATPTASPDHWQARLITDAAVFYSRLSKWEDRFDDLPVHSIEQQLYFRLAFQTDTLPGHAHHISVDISSTLETKLRAVRCYKSQFDHKKGIEDRIRAAALTTGGLAGVVAAESFACVSPLVVSDLAGTLLKTGTQPKKGESERII
ncbi:MAG: PIG-L family deacetylase [Planctomycetota bacterium]